MHRPTAPTGIPTGTTNSNIVEQVRQLRHSPTRLQSSIALLKAAEATPQALQAALSTLPTGEEVNIADELNLKPYMLRYWACGVYPTPRLSPTTENCRQAIDSVIRRLTEQLPPSPKGPSKGQ